MVKKITKITLFFFLFLLFCLNYVFASETEGTIDSTHKWAWGEGIGWINFSPTKGNVQITDNGMSGYAWNENYGWINLSPTKSGVKIDNEGNLSGYAWGENIGWINFSGVKINCQGLFSGTAQTEHLGTITFDCSNCRVVTDYRPPNCREVSPSPSPPPPEPPHCGNGICEPEKGETCETCLKDCGICPPLCGDSKCEWNKGENCLTCPIDCGECPPFCGDYKCNGKETCETCPQDCGSCPPVCGDGKCTGEESCQTCPQDCGECFPPPFCGDGFCKGDETCQNCPQDCGPCAPPPHCGNKICEPEKGETCQTCPEDCICEVSPPVFPFPPYIPPNNPLNIGLEIITTTSLVLTLIFLPSSLYELFLLPTRLAGILLVAFGWKKRRPPWGIVYDSITKQPLDPAYVVLKTLENETTSTAITDIDGRYGFLVEPGIYKIVASKTNYLFPSQKLAGKSKDELYENLYFGEPIEIKKGEVVTRNIPMDPLKFDWNEYIKKSKKLTKFYSQWDVFFRSISDIIYYIGFILAIIAFIVAPYPYNTIILGLYLFLLLLRILGVKPKAFGAVVEEKSGIPLGFAILRIIEASSNREISKRVTDKYGRYFCLVPKGKYYIKIEIKNPDQSYSLVYISKIIDATKTGIIKQKFKVNPQNVITPPPQPPSLFTPPSFPNQSPNSSLSLPENSSPSSKLPNELPTNQNSSSLTFPNPPQIPSSIKNQHRKNEKEI